MPTSAKRKDKFWKLYVLIISLTGVSLVILFVIILTTKIFRSNTAAAVLGLQNEQIQEYPFTETPGIYKDIVSRGWEDWSWDVKTDLASYIFYEKGNSINIEFKKPNAGFMLHAPHFDTSPYKSIKLSIYVSGEKDNSGLFVELTDKNDKVIGNQLLSWYTNDKIFKPGSWYNITIPLDNLNALNTNINGISIISADPVIIYVDDVKFSEEYVYYPKWTENTETPEEYISSVNLPYISDFYYRKNEWRAVSGIMELAWNKMRLETGTTTNYGVFQLRGGNFWVNYRYTIFIDWAIGDSVNLLSRYYGENFFSCSFFDEGINVTLYQFQNGKQIELDSAPNFIMKRKYNWTSTKSLGIEVNGNNVSCLTNGEVKVKHKALYPMPLAGTAAIEIWSPENGQSSMSINKVTVENL
jgi:hypothetical protein